MSMSEHDHDHDESHWPETCSCGQAHVIAVFRVLPDTYDEYSLPDEVHSFQDCIEANRWINDMREGGFQGMLEGMSTRKKHFPEWLDRFKKNHAS